MPHILIVEDSPTQAQQLCFLLEEAGFTTDIADDALQAGQRLEHASFDVVLTDLHLPGESGFDLCRRIKNDPHRRHLRVVVMTSQADPVNVLRGLEAGADGFFSKNLEPSTILGRIRRLLERPAQASRSHVHFLNEEFALHADREQLLDVLLSAFEDVVLLNQQHQAEISQRRQAEAALGQERTRLMRERDLLHALLDNVPDAIYFKDLDSRFLRINKAVSQRFGLESPEDGIARSDLDFFSAEHARQAHKDEQEIIRTGQPIIDKEEEETWPDGHSTWVSTTKLPLRDRAGNIIGTFGISRDITARKRAEGELQKAKEAAEASQRRTRLIVDNAHDAYIAMNSDGHIIDWNPQAEKSFGWAREQVVGRLLHEVLIPPRYHQGHLQGLRHFLHTGAGPLLQKRIEVHALHRDGSEFPVELSISPLRVGSEWIFNAFLHDISERKRAEEELRRAMEAAEAANRAKSEFLANMSHEIRTPMNAIFGMTELLLDTPVSAEQRDYLETVQKSADALLSVINDILDFSKIEAGKLELDRIPFDPRETVEDMLNILALRAHQKGLELAGHITPDVPHSLVGDPGRLRQILVNLVGNALKFTEKGEVVVDVSCQPATEGPAVAGKQAGLHFCVRDTGIGIPAAKQAVIFEAFAQADGSTTRKYGGTGLGLAISSRLVQQMHGRIWVESELGKGSCFHFTAVFDVHDSPLLRPIPAEVERLRGLSVLVVDDNETNRRILGEILTQWQMRPTLVEGGSAALQALHRARAHGAPFGLVLLDAHMPEMDGFMLAGEIKAHPELAGATVMMLSSAGQPLDTRRCKDLNIAAHLNKPVKQAELRQAILAVLGAQPAPTVQVAPGLQPPACRPLRLLLAEDNPVNQKLAIRLLEKQGHTVLVANNGKEALDALERDRFDLVLMDVQMPEMDGLEAAAAIRQRERHTGQHVPIIAMTAHAMKGDRERCLDAGMDGYIAKPIQPRELWQKLSEVVPATPAATEGAFDAQQALHYVAGDEELLRELAELFHEDHPRLVNELQAAVARHDLPEATRVAHTLKGTVSHFGAHAARHSAEQLEALLQQGKLDGVPCLAAALKAQLEQLDGALMKRVQTAGSANGGR